MSNRYLTSMVLVLLGVILLGAAVPGPAAAQTRPPVNLKLYSMSVGGTAYVLSFALSEVINRNHPWIRIESLEARGSVGNLVLLSQKPELRKDTLIFTHEISNEDAREARRPFKNAYKGARAIAALTHTNLVLVTLDKNIKTKADLAGKRLMSMRAGTSTAVLHQTLLKDIWGVADKVKLSHGDFGTIKDALKDGLIDIGAQPINGSPSTLFMPIPTLTALMATKDVYFFNTSADDIRALAKKTGQPVFPSVVPAKALGPKQPEAIHTYGHSLSWWADEQMDEEIVYEITKTIYEHIDDFQKYAGAQGKLIDRATLPTINVSDDLFHKGAYKLYKEKGLAVGVK
ncbi:MAG: TAXI family TRAP transporter solute-binding subunit [Desulfobacterales bacterium]|nr:TAXI family TRAP transporter solute-binding subunit [Desulfobacterales bacterium]